MGNPLLGSLVDAFTGSTLNAALWNRTTGGPVLDTVNDMVSLPMPTTSGGTNVFGTNGPYDATGQQISARVTVAQVGNGTTKTIMRMRLDSNNAVTLRIESGVFKMTMQIGGALTSVTLPTYDPAAHAWWRLRESGGLWYADTSADGYAWTNQASMAYSWSPTALGFQFETQAGATEAAGNFAYFAQINTVSGGVGPNAVMPSWPQIKFQVAWNQGANTAGQPAYMDLSNRLRQTWSTDLAGRQYELDQIQSGDASATLWNLDGALDPENTASPYAPYVLPMRRCRFQAVWPRSPRNFFPAGFANGTDTDDMSTTAGTAVPASGLPPTPTWQTTAFAWTIPAANPVNGTTLGLGAHNTYGDPDPAAWQVTPGLQYTFGVWVALKAGGDTTLKLDYRLSWYDITGTRILVSQGTGQTIGVIGNWTRLAVTLTAPAGAVVSRGGITPTTVPASDTTVYATGWQVEQAAAATPSNPGGVIYDLWTGFVERFPQQWDMSGTYGLIDIQCVDALAGLASFKLQPNLAQSLLALGPAFMYPFNEIAGATQFADGAGKTGRRYVNNSPIGPDGSITAGNAVTGAGSVGSAGPVVTLAQGTTGSSVISKGLFLASPRPLQVPPANSGWTRVICFRTTFTPSGSNYQTMWGSVSIASPTSSAFVILGVDNNGHGFGWVNNANSSASSIIAVPDVVVTDGNWHIMVVQMAADGKTWTVAVDNHGYQSTTTGDYRPSGLVADSIGAVVSGSLKVFQYAFSGDLAYATQFNYAIGNGNALDLGSGFATGWIGETSAARAQRILDMAGYQGPLSTLDADTAMGPANVADVDAMSALQVVGDTEAGQVYLDGKGVIWLAGRKWRYLQNDPDITFGERQDLGEIPYLTDAEIELDDTHINNDVTVSNQPLPGAEQAPGAHVIDEDSQAAYLPRTIERTINVQDDTATPTAAQFLLSQYKQPLTRVGQMTIDGAANPALWSKILPITFGTRAQVVRRPPSPAPTITLQQFVEHVAWEGDDQGNLKATLQMNSAIPYLGWWVVASMHTTVHTASTAGTATVTFDPLPGANLNPARAALSAGAVLTLGYGTANAETLTVKSVATTVPGYASVAVTFTTNTTHNHSVGELVCQPLPAGITLPPAVAASYPYSLDAGATLTDTSPRVAY